MTDTIKERQQIVDWNVLTSHWLTVMTIDAEARIWSPLKALTQAASVRCIAQASPLDLFAAYRFLLTLLYWKADAAGGVKQVRESLLSKEVPRVVLDAIEKEAGCFRLFDEKSPFLQDTSVRDVKSRKSAGSLFAEFASGTNIAHFHHGDDKNMRLCLRCATIGMLRLIPWSQSGGSGVSPSVHNAPPIMAIASGGSLAITLGLNLVPLSTKTGSAKWTGHFAPDIKATAIPYLKALTWNPRRVYLPLLQGDQVCWRCGQPGIVGVGPIVYLKNEETKMMKDKKKKSIPWQWQDPAAFYAAGMPYTTMKSTREAPAASGRDLCRLLDDDEAPKATVVVDNPGHQEWRLIIPCTNPFNNKTFDHRQLDLPSISPDAIRATLTSDLPASGPQGLDGWTEPRRATQDTGAAPFVRSAARLLTHTDWATLSAAAYREMHDSPAAFDVLTGLLWSLRGKFSGLPSRKVAWLVLKLMATVSPRARVPHVNALFSPLRSLPKRQLEEHRKNRSVPSLYPVSFPRGHRLESNLRRALDSNMRRRTPERVDWAGLCYSLDQLLD